jgi:hypothetical protein
MRTVFEQLLYVDVLRGHHSTGACVVAVKKNPIILKEEGQPEWLLNSQEWIKKVDYNDKINFAYLGHNRYATQGRVNRRNAHPFSHGHITLAHNGTLHVYDNLKLGNNNFGTDSETICYHISKKGIKDTWSKIDGAAALNWWDHKRKTMSFITNGQRPLHYGITMSGRHLLMASEAWMIEGVAERNKVVLRNVQACKAHVEHVISWDPDKKCVTVDYEEHAPFRRPVVGSQRGLLPLFPLSTDAHVLDADFSEPPKEDTTCVFCRERIAKGDEEAEDVGDGSYACCSCSTVGQYYNYNLSQMKGMY